VSDERKKSEIEDLCFSFFRNNYTTSIDKNELSKVIVEEIMLFFKRTAVSEIEKSEIENLINGWLSVAHGLNGQEAIVVEDEDKDLEDVKLALDELGIKAYKNVGYKSIRKITDNEIYEIKEKKSNIVDVAVTDLLDSTFTEYPPKRLIRAIQATPYKDLLSDSEDKTEADIWIEVAKNNLIAIAQVVEKLKKRHVIMITKIAKDYLCEIVDKIYNDDNCAKCIAILFNDEKRSNKSAITEAITNSKTLMLFQTGNITLFSKPYYDDNAAGENNNENNTALISNPDEYEAESIEFQNTFSEVLFEILIKKGAGKDEHHKNR